MDKAEFLSIKKLIDLVNEERLVLPNVQRGFVWKPYQIENLWDSLLRRFPSGAIITRPNSDNSFQLLDGQQRTTSIALGFANIEGANEDARVLRSSTKSVRIFFDMRKPDPDKEGKAYAFRVITRSHPWGYQRADNTKPIETANKSKALRLWEKSDPFADGVLESAYPWDAVGPLPLNIFTQAALNGSKLDQLKQDLLRWVQGVAIATSEDRIATWLEDFKSSRNDKPVRRHETNETYTIEEIYEKIKEMVGGYTVPMQPLPESMFEDNSPVLNSDSDSVKSEIDVNSDKDENDEIEEVFVRLNSAGTPLGGEELNYSIIKAKVGQAFQEKIEKACEGIMKPARLITVAFRLYQKTIGDDSTNLRIKPKQFQREMRKENKFVDFIDDKILDGGLLESVRSVLKFGVVMNGYNKESIEDYRLPYPLFIKVAAASRGEIMFMLMYRLLIGGNKKPDVFNYGSVEHRKMIGIMLIFMWHGKDSRSRHGKLLEQVWASVKVLQFEEMWSNKLISVAMGKTIDPDVEPKFELKPMPMKPDFFYEIRKVQRNSKIWGKIKYGEFFDNVMCNRDLLLWVQRKFLSDCRFFRDDLFRLDDTDVPFDWDHISPENLVKNKKNLPSPLRDIYYEPCNLRAWPYQLNRSDQDDIPARKLSINDANRTFLKSALQGDGDRDINSYLLESSFCKQVWKKFDEEWLDQSKISEKYWQNVYGLIYDRWVGMSRELFNELQINALANIKIDAVKKN